MDAFLDGCPISAAISSRLGVPCMSASATTLRRPMRPRAFARAAIAAAGDRVRESREAVAGTLASPNLLRTQLSFGLIWSSEWAFTTALAVVAYQSGGAAAVGLVGVLRMLPAALAAPFASALAERRAREQVLALVGVVRGAALAAAFVAYTAGAPAGVLYALAVVAAVVFVVHHPVHSALLPALCRTPQELTTANVVRGVLDAVSSLAGPLLAALALALSGPEVVFAAAALISAWSGALMLRVRYERAALHAPPKGTRLLADVREGIAALRAHADARLLVVLCTAQTFVRGALNILAVVIALDLLAMGDAGVGIVSAAVGAGAIVGSISTTMLVAGRRLAAWFGVGLVLWGLPLVFIGAWPALTPALVMLALVGVGNAIVDVACFTVLARIVPDAILARVFGVLESLIAASIALGSIVAPIAIAVAGVRGALVAIGVLLPFLVAATWRRLKALDAGVAVRDAEIEALRRVPLLRPLPVPTIEYLATRLRVVDVPAGEDVFHQGDAGDDFYVIVDGRADCVGDGRLIRTMGPGDGFGEIALLRDVPRTTTITARDPLRLFALAQEHFVPAVSGYTDSAGEAEAMVGSHLASFRPQGVSI